MSHEEFDRIRHKNDDFASNMERPSEPIIKYGPDESIKGNLGSSRRFLDGVAEMVGNARPDRRPDTKTLIRRELSAIKKTIGEIEEAISIDKEPQCQHCLIHCLRDGHRRKELT